MEEQPTFGKEASGLSTVLPKEQIVLILVGLIGSGKSTFAHALEEHVPHFRRCNQDDLGDRRSVEARARQALEQGLSVCIDRTNFDAQQRATWINIAREFPGTLVWVLVLDTPYEVCAARLRERTDHPTIKTPAQALELLARFAAQLRLPAPHEGHTRLLRLRPTDHPAPVYSAADVLGILQRVRDAPAVVPLAPGGVGDGSFRRRGFSRGRGRGFRGAPTSAARGAWTSYGRPGGGGYGQSSSDWRMRSGEDRDRY
ncbi:P-loop containing nucleoside triphosphate hydrolase protein [Amylocystis lapponica]|nr:P-loop containing nucleoside triphosphate hydrolase protein [Amylocystis lapponica]